MSTMTFNNVRLVKVVDGDTVRLDVDLGFNTWRLNEPYRLAFINAPEMNTNEGWNSKTSLVAKLNNEALNEHQLSIIAHAKDKYGRWLIELFAGDLNVNFWLVANNLAVNVSLKSQLEQ